MTCIVDTPSINLTVAAGQLSADVIVDPASGIAPNPLVINAAGVYARGADGWLPLPVTLAYSSADGHTFVATTSVDLTGYIGPGDRIRLTQSATVKYFIVTAIAGATITLYGGTDYTLANAAITLPYFSKVKSPIGFPLNPAKWAEVLTDGSNRLQASPVVGTWYNPGGLSLDMPIGVWNVEFEPTSYGDSASGSLSNVRTTLSTANNNEVDAELSCLNFVFQAGGTQTTAETTQFRRKTVAATVKTTYFLNAMTPSSGVTTVGFANAGQPPTVVRFICAYL